MLDWLSKGWDTAKRVLGKIKTGIEGAGQVFDKGKQIYEKGKNFATSLPVVGAVAKEMINKAENKANAYAKEKTGLNFQDIDKGVSTARNVSKYLPSG